MRRPGGFCCNDAATTEIYTLSLHDALPTLSRMRPLTLVHLFFRPPRARGKFLFCELRRGASALHLEMEPPADRLRRDTSHPHAPLSRVGDVDFCVFRFALSDLGCSSRFRGGG